MEFLISIYNSDLALYQILIGELQLSLEQDYLVLNQ